MTRLPKGALVKLSAILASTVLVSPFPCMAADLVSPQGNEPTVKTLPPLAEAPQTVTQNAPESKGSLQFTPSSDSSDPSLLSKSQWQIDGATPALPVSGAPSAVATPNPVSVPDAMASEQTLSTPAPSEATQAAPVLQPEIPMPTAASAQQTPVMAPEMPPSPNKEMALSAPAPAEVSAPEPLNTANGAGPTPDSPAAGQQVAQAVASRNRSPLDPTYTKLPTTTGTVKTRHTFDRFPTNQIIHNLAFRDTPVKEVVAELGNRGNLNIVIDKSTQGRITGNLHDVTLNEAMDSVLTSSGLQWRQLDNSTVVIGTPNALANLGLNRPMMRAFKLSYASAFDISQLLWASVFNRGFLPDYSTAVRARSVNVSKENPITKTAEEISRAGTAPAPGGGSQASKSTTISTNNQENNEESEAGEEFNSTTRPDNARSLRGQLRYQTNEGTGFNNAATDPGSQTIRAYVPVVTDFAVDQNGGSTIVMPDVKNNQVLVCGTQEDINIAEEAIRLLDRRPRQVHIQSSLIEIHNEGIRQLGAALNLQGAGASSSVLGGSGAPLVNFLPGLGSAGQQLTQTFTNGIVTGSSTNNVAGIPPVPQAFSSTLGAVAQTLAVLPGLSNVPGPPNNGFGGFLGTALPITTPSTAGVTAVPQAQTGFNFLTLSKRAGGVANIATMPAGLNMTLNLVLQTDKAKVLANPSLVVTENTEALITLANEVVHKVTTTVSLGVVSTNVELVKAGIFLNVLPRVTEDGFINLRLRPQVSAPLGGPQVFAGGSVIVTLLNVREVMTQEVRIKDGQTLVIGGLFTEQESATLAKVPYLSEAPILGALFRNSIKGRNRSELMLMITPKIVEEQPPGQISEGNVPQTL